MPGFFISNVIKDFQLNNYYDERCITNEIVHSKYTIKRNTLKKFLDDKVFYEDNQCVIITEGVILNKSELLEKRGIELFAEAIKELKSRKENFFIDFRGAFSGAYYDKAEEEWTIYTNHVGDRPIFYYYEDGRLFIGASVDYIVDALKLLSISYNLDETALYNLLAYGSMVDNRTMIRQIKKLYPGQLLKFKESDLEVSRYHQFTNTSTAYAEMTEAQIIDLMDEKFRHAVKMEYDKDLEYGYKHFANLSGGLDSRMNNFVAKDLGFKNILNFTFSQSYYLEETISRQVVKFLGNEYVLKTADDAKYIKDLDQVVKMSYGLTEASGIGISKAMADTINYDTFGVGHTGMMGDSVISTPSLKIYDKPKAVYTVNGTSVNKYADKADRDFMKLYENEGIYTLYCKDLIGSMGSQLAATQMFEPVSPFADVDFMELCMNVPLELKHNYGIYIDWIKSKYPDAANFAWERTGAKITDNKTVTHYKSLYKHGIGRRLKRFCKKHKIKMRFRQDDKEMHPYGYWYENNKEIKSFMDNYLKENIKTNVIDDSVKCDLVQMYYHVTAREKIQVLTALSVIKLYFG